MARGTTLATLRAMLKAELGDANEANTALDFQLNYLLANKQKDLANMYDWAFLEHRWDLSCSAGSRYLDIPSSDVRSQACTINFERPVNVQCKYNSNWINVAFGVDNSYYVVHDSDSDERSDPIQNWRFSTNSSESANADEIEIWPIPETAQTLRFTGQRTLYALTSDEHKADLDDLLVVYFVAAERMLLEERAQAQLVFTKAQQHLIRLRAGYPVTRGTVVFGKNLVSSSIQQEPKLVAIA